jgi:hypothetical protein
LRSIIQWILLRLWRIIIYFVLLFTIDLWIRLLLFKFFSHIFDRDCNEFFRYFLIFCYFFCRKYSFLNFFLITQLITILLFFYILILFFHILILSFNILILFFFYIWIWLLFFRINTEPFWFYDKCWFWNIANFYLFFFLSFDFVDFLRIPSMNILLFSNVFIDSKYLMRWFVISWK